MDEVERRIRQINTVAEVIPAQFAKVDLHRILGVGAFSLERVLESDPTFLSASEHQHDLTVTSVGIEADGDLAPDRLNAWLGRLLREQGTDIFRSKGILAIVDQANRYVFQGVHMLLDGAPGAPWADGETRRNRLVFIGRNLDRAELEKGFRSCLVG